MARLKKKESKETEIKTGREFSPSMDLSNIDFESLIPDKLTEQVLKEQLTFFKNYKTNPLDFFFHELGISTEKWINDAPRAKNDRSKPPLWSKQREIVNAVVKYRKVAVKSGHSSGKSFLLARLVLYLAYAWHALGITTAPTFRQVKRVLWGEIHDAYNNAPKKLGGKLTQTSLELGDKWFVEGFSTKDPAANIAGFHEETVFVAIDEAGGVDSIVFDVIEGILSSPNSFVILIGNPLDEKGKFAEIFQGFEDRDGFNEKSGYYCITINCYDTPNVKHGINLYPKLCDKDWPDKMAEKWGKDSNLFRVKVLGQFPVDGGDVLIPFKYVQRAFDAYEDYDASKTDPVITMGVDVARFGCFDDQTEILTEDGWKLFDNLIGDERILSLNTSTDIAEWMPITEVHKYPFEGELNLYESERMNFCFTDNHRLYAKGQSGGFKIKRFDKLPIDFQIKRTNSWEGTDFGPMKFVSSCEMPNGGVRNKEWNFTQEDWAEFLGWYFSEGHVFNGSKRPNSYEIGITQRHLQKREIIKNLLNRMGIIFRENKIARQFIFQNAPIGKHLRQFGHKAPNKFLPKYLKDAPPHLLKIFLEAFRLGDGCCRKDGTGKTYFSTSKKMIEDIQEIGVKLGIAGKYVFQPLSKIGHTTMLEGKLHTRKHDLHVLYERRDKVNSDVSKRKMKRIKYSGFVHCVSTPYETIAVRRKGCTMWSGNSDSTVIMARRRSGRCEILEVTEKERETETVGRIIFHYENFKSMRQEPQCINVDDTGLGGGVVDMLWERGYPVNSIISQEGADEIPGDDRIRFINKRAQYYWKLRTVFHEGKVAINDWELGHELSKITTDKFLSEGRMKISDKDDLKKKIGRSPDRADCLMLCFSEDEQVSGQDLIAWA